MVFRFNSPSEWAVVEVNKRFLFGEPVDAVFSCVIAPVSQRGLGPQPNGLLTAPCVGGSTFETYPA